MLLGAHKVSSVYVTPSPFSPPFLLFLQPSRATRVVYIIFLVYFRFGVRYRLISLCLPDEQRNPRSDKGGIHATHHCHQHGVDSHHEAGPVREKGSETLH